ncbi:uncharacterized protein LOC120678764 [Panicum virgatum]|uniref:DUF4220 domain-containing protein n=1 Tax=Panicum virgatum TaxID=38727 RepID=A0A8T0R2C0_PANVG|nr:uncharacterized protein LOC120678764 [Panicum virgatum]KAG2579456.1 hypothetical protein PVAP13_6NG288400 [Panicum virgatum]
MRTLRDSQACVCDLRWRELNYPPAAAQDQQHSLVSHAQHLWNDWEIQCLVLVSFSLQVFLLFSAVFRKRHRSVVLSVLLWLAYLSADSVAVYLLGRLTLLVGDDPRHQIVLFWAPFLLLHLGGQETMTAFSMEDCALWKRHLLNLATQVSLAVYVVCRQWRGGTKQLVAPTTLMFIAGMTSYAERIVALKRAQPSSSMSSSESSNSIHTYKEDHGIAHRMNKYYDKQASIISQKQERNFSEVMELATFGFSLGLDFLMDVAKGYLADPTALIDSLETEEIMLSRRSSDTDDMSFKLAEIHLSLIYDHLYTKFGGNLMAVCCRLTTFALTSIALVLFVVSTRLDHKGNTYYETADITISYILLVGAIALEISSVFLWLLSSYSPWKFLRTSSGAGRVLYSIIKYLGRLESRVEWSWKMQQLNMVDWCIQERQTTAGWLERMKRCVGIEGRACTKPVEVSADLKNLVLHKMLKTLRGARPYSIAPGIRQWVLDLTKFRGQWAQVWVHGYSISNSSQRRLPQVVQRLTELLAKTKKREKESSAAPQRAPEINSQFQDLGFVKSVFLWHLVTDLCLLEDQADNDTTTTTTTTTSSKNYKLKSSIRELSNYVMYLLVKCKATVTLYDIDSLSGIRQSMLRAFIRNDQQVDRRYILENIRKYDDVYGVFGKANSIALELIQVGKEEEGLWDLIAIVWVEMLCYIAFNCDAAFHTKQLCAGGEFVTHVKMLLLILDFSF